MQTFRLNVFQIRFPSQQDEKSQSFIAGNALYMLSSLYNHSCAPNAKILFEHSNQAHVIAVKPISKGEEIVISYIDESLPKKERQFHLQPYGNCQLLSCFVSSDTFHFIKKELYVSVPNV